MHSKKRKKSDQLTDHDLKVQQVTIVLVAGDLRDGVPRAAGKGEVASTPTDTGQRLSGEKQGHHDATVGQLANGRLFQEVGSGAIANKVGTECMLKYIYIYINLYNGRNIKSKSIF